MVRVVRKPPLSFEDVKAADVESDRKGKLLCHFITEIPSLILLPILCSLLIQLS